MILRYVEDRAASRGMDYLVMNGEAGDPESGKLLRNSGFAEIYQRGFSYGHASRKETGSLIKRLKTDR